MAGWLANTIFVTTKVYWPSPKSSPARVCNAYQDYESGVGKAKVRLLLLQVFHLHPGFFISWKKQQQQQWQK